MEFLQKKGHAVDSTPNAKISEEEYEMLVKEFSQDMSLKQEAERLVQERTNRDKQKPSSDVENESTVEIPAETGKAVDIAETGKAVDIKVEDRKSVV